MPLTFTEFDLFPNEPDKNAFIVKLYTFVEHLSLYSLYVQFWIAIIGIILTIFHLIVLIKLCGNSIVSIMLGMAICDLFSMIVNISVCDIILHFFGDLCTPPYSLLVNHVFWILVSIRDDVIRCSTWLSVLMALLRYLVSKYFAKSQFQNLSRFEYGVKASIISFVISSIFSAGYYLSVKFEPVGIWTPDESCANVPMNMEHPIYEQRVSDLFSLGNGAPLRIFQLINGSVSKIIPCILLPILTFLLAVELRKNDQSRNTGSVLYKNNTEKTTILVIIMTVLIFVASLPTGIATVFQVAYTDLGYLFLFIYTDTFCNTLLLTAAAINCFICFAMSIQYRKAARKILHIPDPKIHSTRHSLWRTTS